MLNKKIFLFLLLPTILLLAACNTANPVWWEYGVPPGGSAEWGTPSETCDPLTIELGDPYIDGFYLCQRRNDILPMDDPIFVQCEGTAAEPDGTALLPQDEVFAVFDGIHARAYSFEWLQAREGIHDWMAGTPIFVDW